MTGKVADATQACTCCYEPLYIALAAQIPSQLSRALAPLVLQKLNELMSKLVLLQSIASCYKQSVHAGALFSSFNTSPTR